MIKATYDIANLELLSDIEGHSQMSAPVLYWMDLFLTDPVFMERRAKRILEFGSGYSTVWMAKTYPDYHIYSLEGDKTWYDKVNWMIKTHGLENITLVYEKQTNFYISDNTNNMNYIDITKTFPHPFDLIINDGGMREIVGDFILQNADEYIAPFGVYIRHDYEKAILGDWVGFRLKLPKWVKDKRKLGYDAFCNTHPNYDLITVPGDALWGHKAEMGGIWHR